MAQEEQKNNIEEKKEEYKNLKGMGFFKKVKYSIVNIEKYPEMATEGLGKALSYIAKLVVILAIILSVWTLMQTNQMIREGITYLQNEFPDFSYNEGVLTVNSEEVITIENEQFGKIIVIQASISHIHAGTVLANDSLLHMAVAGYGQMHSLKHLTIPRQTQYPDRPDPPGLPRPVHPAESPAPLPPSALSWLPPHPPARAHRRFP